jgi:hypothetical protein
MFVQKAEVAFTPGIAIGSIERGFLKVRLVAVLPRAELPGCVVSAEPGLSLVAVGEFASAPAV